MGFFDQLIVKTLPLVPKVIVARLSKPYIAGAELDHAVKCVKRLNEGGFRATIDVLGEFITSFDQVEDTIHDYLHVLQAVEEHKLDANISIKPTFFGLLLDENKSTETMKTVLQETVRRGNFMRMDMEDSPCTSKTIETYLNFRKSFGPHLGIVLQAMLRRSMTDIEDICAQGAGHFRLCKGVYVEPESVAFQGYQEIRENYLACLERMFDLGAYVGIATHDQYLVEQAEKMIQRRGLNSDLYEFQMLLGVRETLRDAIKGRGHHVRVYVPFGRDWYGYSTRRLKENPALAGTFFKAIFFNK